MTPISVEQIMQMPHAAILAERIQTALEAEKEKRLQFYKFVEENIKTEFINGETINHLPDTLAENKATTALTVLLSTFVETKDLGFVGSFKLMISLTRNDYEPDICFFENSKAQHFTSAQMQFPAPDLIIEVLSDSTADKDRTVKFDDYEAHGVREYWIIDPEKEIIEQYFLQNGVYELMLKAKTGDLTGVVLPDFTIPIRAVFDEQINLKVLGEMLHA